MKLGGSTGGSFLPWEVGSLRKEVAGEGGVEAPLLWGFP